MARTVADKLRALIADYRSTNNRAAPDLVRLLEEHPELTMVGLEGFEVRPVSQTPSKD